MLQGSALLELGALTLVVFISIRLVNKAAPRIGEHRRNLLTIVLCALCILGGVIVRVVVIETMPVQIESDFQTYFRIAGELASDTMLTPEADFDRQYIAMYPYTVGYPMFVLTPAFRIFGESVKVALYVNLICSSISLILCAHIGWRLVGRLGAVLVSLLMSFWPSHVLFSNMVDVEPSFTLLLLIAIELMIVALRRNTGSLYDKKPGQVMVVLMILGIVLAIANAIWPMAIVLLIAFAVVQLMVGGDPEGKVSLEGTRFALKKGWFCVLLVLVAYFLTSIIITRTVYDTILEKPASGINASGYNLMVGLNTESEGLWNLEDSEFFENAYDQTGDADEAHRACMQVAVQRITGEPKSILNLLVLKYRNFWQTDDFGVDWNLQQTELQGKALEALRTKLESVRHIGRLLYMAILFGSLMCALSAWRGKRAPHPMFMVSVLFYLGTALVRMLLETQVRYHYNMLPFLILMAVMGVVQWRKRLAIEPAVRVVYQQVETKEEVKDDHTHFDMRQALIDGNIIMTVTEAYQAMEEATPAESGASAEAAAAGDGDSAEPSAAAENPPVASADDESGEAAAVVDDASAKENEPEAKMEEGYAVEVADAETVPGAESAETGIGDESASAGDVKDVNAADGAEAEKISEAEPVSEGMDAPTIETTVDSIPDEGEAMVASEAEPIPEAESTFTIGAVEENVESDAEAVSEAEPIGEEERIPQAVTAEESVADESKVEPVSKAPSISEAANVSAIDVEKKNVESDAEAVSEAEPIDEEERIPQAVTAEESVADESKVEPVSEAPSISESENMPAIGPMEEPVESGIEAETVAEKEGSPKADAAKVDAANGAAIKNVTVAKPAYRGKHASKAVAVPESVTSNAEAEAVPKVKPRGRHASKAVAAPESVTSNVEAKVISEAKVLLKTEATREGETPAIPTAATSVTDNVEAVTDAEPTSEEETPAIEATEASATDEAETEVVPEPEPIHEEETPAMETVEESVADDVKAIEDSAARGVEAESIPGAELVSGAESVSTIEANGSNTAEDAEVTTEAISDAEPAGKTEAMSETDESVDGSDETEGQTIGGDKNSEEVAWSRRTSQRGMPARMMGNQKSRRKRGGMGTH